MTAEESSNRKHCKGCVSEHACRTVWSQERRGPFNAAGLSLACAAGFLLPCVAAIGIGAVVDHYEKSDAAFSGWVFAGMAGGFIVGAVAAAWLIVRIKRRFGKK